MSTVYLKEDKTQARELWQSLPLQAPFFHKLRKLIRFYKEYCKKKAVAFRAKEEECKADLHTTTADLHAQPDSYAL